MQTLYESLRKCQIADVIFRSAPYPSNSAPHETKGSKLSRGRESELVTVLKMLWKTSQHCRR